MSKTIFFFCQDPGSTNALLPVISQIKNTHNPYVFATKYAKDILKKQKVYFVDLDHLEFIPADYPPANLIITGSSAGYTPEKTAIIYGRDSKIPTISILDFWGNYQQRYSQESGDLKYLPNYIFVMDPTAKKNMIEEGYPEDKIVVTGNPFFDTFSKSNKSHLTISDSPILYVSQPILKDGKYCSVYNILDDILEVLSKLCPILPLIIRPHPKEEKNNYDQYLNNKITVDYNSPISSLLVQTSIVIGKDSMVLMEAVFSGKLVISYQKEKVSEDRLITNSLGFSHLIRSKEDLLAFFQRVVAGDIKVKSTGVIPYLNDQKCTQRAIAEINRILTLPFQKSD